MITVATLIEGNASAQAPPSFAAHAELVTVDVVALGPDGNPVPGLRRDDFVVKEDGRAQKLTAFETVEALVPELASPATVAASPSQARVVTNVAGPPTRRTFAFVFDDLHVNDINVERAKRAVETFVVRQTAPGDRLVLATVSDARYWATTRGGEDTAWLESLARVRSHAPLRGRPECQPTFNEAMQIELGNHQVADLVERRVEALCKKTEQLGVRAIGAEMQRAGATPSSASRGAPMLSASGASMLYPTAPEVYSRGRGQLSATLRVVREIIVTLGEPRGHKALVLVTEGFPVDPSLDVFRDVREQAARANVVINFLDARGLPVGQPEFMSAAGGSSLLPAADIAPTVSMWRLGDAGAKALADETGGLVLQTNDLLGGLVKVADEARVTYLLGYEPTNEKRDGRYRKLEVEVRRPGLRVRARKGYFAARTRDDSVPKLRPAADRALRSVFDTDGIPLRLAVYVMGPAPVQSPIPGTGVEVLIAGELRLDALQAEVKDGLRVAEPKVKLVTSSRAGESHASDWSLQITLSHSLPKSGDALWHPFITRIAMMPGDHRARLVVQSGERVGSVTADFIVPPLTEERLSTPILSDRVVADGSERDVLPLARRSFGAESTLHCWVEIHSAPLDNATGEPRLQASFVARSLDGRQWAAGPPTPMKTESGGRVTRLLNVPLADAPPGEQELVLRVRDDVSGATFEAREPFRVETRQ